jgi:hypothetical protein
MKLVNIAGTATLPELASDHRTWAQRGGYGGYYIPHFGSQHFSASARSQLCIWDIRGSSTAGFHSCWSIQGRKPGRKAGMPPMTFTSTMTMDITFATAGIRN